MSMEEMNIHDEEDHWLNYLDIITRIQPNRSGEYEAGRTARLVTAIQCMQADGPAGNKLTKENDITMGLRLTTERITKN